MVSRREAALVSVFWRSTPDRGGLRGVYASTQLAKIALDEGKNGEAITELDHSVALGSKVDPHAWEIGDALMVRAFTSAPLKHELYHVEFPPSALWIF